MKFSGITRRIDELGRIVVPKEMRYNLGIRDGDALEVYVENNSIVIKKYSEMANIKDVSMDMCIIISDACNVDIFITDREKIVASNNNLKYLIDQKLSNNHKDLIDRREFYKSKSKEKLYNVEGYFTIVPIITSVDCVGLVVIITSSENIEALKYARIVQKSIVKKLDVTC